MNSRHRLTILLCAVLAMGVFGWMTTVRTEIKRLDAEIAKRMEHIAARLRLESTCVELHAQRRVLGGEPFCLMAPSEVDAGHLDTITTYRAVQEPADKVLHMAQLPMPLPAIVDIRLRVRYQPPLPSDAGSYGAAIDPKYEHTLNESLRWNGGQLPIVDWQLLEQLMSENMGIGPLAQVEYMVVDTLKKELLRTSEQADTVALWEEGFYEPIYLREQAGPPLVLIARYPHGAREVALAEMPMLAAFLLLVMGLALALWQHSRATLAKEKLAQMQIDLVSNITHELNTPIANIALALDTLRKTPGGGSRISNDQLWDIIHVENKRLHANIKKVLDVSMLDGKQLMLQPEMHDVNVLLTAVAEEFRLAAQRRNITMDLNLRAQKPWVRADATYITNVFHSLIDNAIKYGGDRAHVILTTSDQQAGVMVEVYDNGPGIPKTDRELVFQKFYRVRNGDRYAVKGTGIGLFYARQVIEAHGGWINLANDERPGCCFQMLVPSESKANDKVANS